MNSPILSDSCDTNELVQIDLGISPILQCETNNGSTTQGTKGFNAYEIAVQQGFIGTVNQWLISLQGLDGIDGLDGRDLYDIWLGLGNVGTEQNMLDSIASSQTITEEIIATTAFGAISFGTTGFLNLTLTQFAKKLLLQTLTPTLVAPTFSLTSVVNLVQKVGSIINIPLVFNFNRGSILGALVSGSWNQNALQGLRAGAAQEYFFNFSGLDADQLSNSYTALNRTILLGNNLFSASVAYSIGPQPLNSLSANFSTPLANGISPSVDLIIEGAYPLFATTVAVAYETEQAITSMSIAEKVLTLAAELDGEKQFFMIPSIWITNNPLTALYYFNTLSGQYDLVNRLSDFSISVVTVSIAGVNVNYYLYTNTSFNRGQITLKLIF